jgi:hypothetical protein
LQVYLVSNLYDHIIQVASSASPATRYWVDYGDGAGIVTSGNCANLPVQNTTVSNNTTRPTYLAYPLQVDNPGQPFNPSGTPFYELYQFAFPDTYYSTSNGLHTGTDFFKGRIANDSSVGIPVTSVADAQLIAAYDPCSSTGTQNKVISEATTWAQVQTLAPGEENLRAYILLRHGNTLVLYEHLQPCRLRLGVVAGGPVVLGQTIGYIAANERVSHLHLEVRTYGLNTFDLHSAPVIFVNAWEYYYSTFRTYIDQNLDNRRQDDLKALPGWDNRYSPGTYRVQCFSAQNRPPWAPTATTPISGNVIYGFSSDGTPNYRAYQWVSGTQYSTYDYPIQGGVWQTFCTP